MIAAAMAMAMHLDLALAGMLAAGLAVLVIIRPDRLVVAEFCASIAGFAVTLVRADTLPAVPFVDGILYSSFEVHALAGVALTVGSVLLLVRAFVGWHREPANRLSHAAISAVWLAAVAAAAIGNYPTPLVGYGGSAIIGYVLSLAAWPTLAAVHGGATSQAHAGADRTSANRHQLVGPA